MVPHVNGKFFHFALDKMEKEKIKAGSKKGSGNDHCRSRDHPSLAYFLRGD